MPSTPDFPIKKPTSIWHKPIKVNFTAFFKAIGSASVGIASGQLSGLGRDAVEVLTAIGLDRNKPAEAAWALIYHAMTHAVCSILSETSLTQAERDSSLRTFLTKLDGALTEHSLCITQDFFKQPEQFALVIVIQPLLCECLESLGVEPVMAAELSRHLPMTFTAALNEEWQQHPEEYEQIRAHMKTPFTSAHTQQRCWEAYNTRLQEQVEAPILSANFGLTDVYVPLRGYYTRIASDKRQEKVVVDLARSLNEWIQTKDPKDAVRIISGGPGSGKSSFVKIFAAHYAKQNRGHVLFIPLHHPCFDQAADFEEGIERFVQYDLHLKQKLLDPDNETLELLIIIDGLDELSFQSNAAQHTVHSFFKEVRRTVKLFNLHSVRVQIIMTGREVTIQDSLEDVGKILHVLPYVVSNSRPQPGIPQPYVDKQKLLETDQRDQWWEKYGALTKTNYSSLPDRIRHPALREITAQPLLNYLVAISYLEGKLSSRQANLNTVYADLLEAVYVRGYDDNGKHLAITEISESAFQQMLEMIALCAWQRRTRRVTIREVEALCKRHNAVQLLSVFTEDSTVGITRLLTAFYFRQSDRKDGEQTFEFTHKSFGEYLVAHLVADTMEVIQAQLSLKDSDPDLGWHPQEALLHWINICGPAQLNSSLLSFIRREIALRPIEQVQALQDKFSQLITFMLQQGMPVDQVAPPLKFKEQRHWARNSEEALLAALNACALVTQKLSNIQWPNRDSFSVWITHLQRQRNSENDQTVAFSSLSYLDLSHAFLEYQDLHCANLECTNLSYADLYSANLENANLRKSDLMSANLQKAVLDCACLDGASLDEANLEYASLNRASLVQASLIDADLHCARLAHASLNNASLNNAIFRGADLKNTTLKLAQLKQADLSDACLEASDFYRACLNEANLGSVCLYGARCTEAQFQRASLEGANCEGSSLNAADLSDAILDNANFEGTSFLQANLDGASLEMTNLRGARLVYSSLRHTTVAGANVAEANFEGVDWDEQTIFSALEGLDRAICVPPPLVHQNGPRDGH